MPCLLLTARRDKALVRIQNKEVSSSSATTAAEFMAAHDYTWMLKAMDQLSMARQVCEKQCALLLVVVVGWGTVAEHAPAGACL
jgi:hypothetical protein